MSGKVASATTKVCLRPDKTCVSWLAAPGMCICGHKCPREALRVSLGAPQGVRVQRPVKTHGERNRHMHAGTAPSQPVLGDAGLPCYVDDAPRPWPWLLDVAALRLPPVPCLSDTRMRRPGHVQDLHGQKPVKAHSVLLRAFRGRGEVALSMRVSHTSTVAHYAHSTSATTYARPLGTGRPLLINSSDAAARLQTLMSSAMLSSRRSAALRAGSHAVKTKQIRRVYLQQQKRRGACVSATDVAADTSRATQRSLVVAVDDDKISWEAVKYTLQELFRDGDVLHLLHVIPKDAISVPVPHSSLASMSYAGDSLDFETLLEEHAMQFIRQTMVGLADARKARCEVDIIRGNSRECIGAAICKTAEELEASLIVVPGWKSLSVFDQFFGQDRTYGQYVAQNATRPVCVYQPPSHAARR